MTQLRPRAEALAAPLPPLLAHARQLAAGVVLGEHGRRRPGPGEAFWQYRAARPGDPARAIDWRRSARSDQPFVQEKEWQAAQSVLFWVDRSRAMDFSSSAALPSKADRAALLALATAVLLLEGGERVGLLGETPQRGALQLDRMARALEPASGADYGVPPEVSLPRHARTVFLSDFLGDLAPLKAALARAAEQGVTGALLQILDPAEETFPYEGRTLFRSSGGSLEYETRRAGDLRARYRDRLAARKAELADLARAAGWHYQLHHSDAAPVQALLWLYRTLEGRG